MSGIGTLTALTPATLPGPEEPQRMMVSPDGKNLYVCGAKKGGANAGLWVYTRNTTTGALTFLEEFTTELNGCYDVWVTEFEGKSFVYVCNRYNPAAKAMAYFKREPATGKLTKEGFVECAGIVENAAEGAAGGGCHSIEGTVDHKFLYVCTQSEPAKVFQFKINQTTGKPEALTPASVEVSGKLMFGLRIIPAVAGKQPYVYGTLLQKLFSQSPGEIVVYKRDETTGLLTQVERTSSGTGLLSSIGSASTTGSEPVDVVISPDGKNVYIGSENTAKIFMFTRSRTTGVLSALGTGFIATTSTEGTEEPRTLAISPDGKSLYAGCFANAVSAKAKVVVYERKENGELKELEAVGSGIEGIHGVVVTPDGKNVYVCDYGNKKLFGWTRNTTTGALTVQTTVAAGAFPNGIVAVEISGVTYVYAANRNEGKAENSTISQYKRGGSGELVALAAATITAGQNPHDLAISADGKYLYCVNAAERGGSKTINQYKINQSEGVLENLSPSTIEYTTAAGSGTAEKIGGRSLAASPDNLSLYMSCGQGSVVQMFHRDVSTGLLRTTAPLTASAGLRGYGLAVSADNNNVYLANEGSASISQYTRKIVECCGECVMSPDGKHLYVTNKEPISGLPTETIGGKAGVEVNPNGVSMFSINAASGQITLLEPATVQTVEEPRGVHIDAEGKNVYVCCQGREFIYVFNREATTGLLTLNEIVDTGAETREPSHGCLSPDGKSFYNSDKNLKTEESSTVGKLISQWSRTASAVTAPAITKPSDQESEKGKAVTELVVSSTGSGLTFTAKNLPPGLSINASTGAITGTPTKWGTYEPTVTVTNAGGSSTTQFFWKVKVEAAANGVVWRMDAEKTGLFEEWACIGAAAEGRCIKETATKIIGSAAYKIELVAGDEHFGERAELLLNPQNSGFTNGVNLTPKEIEEDKAAQPIFKEGDDTWLAFQVMLDAATYPINWPSWQLVWQIHSIEPEVTPSLAITVEKGKWNLVTDSANTERAAERISRWTEPAVAGRWVKFLMHIKWSRDGTVGFVELWVDLGDGAGLKQRLVGGVNQYKVWTLKASGNDPTGEKIVPKTYPTCPADFQFCQYRDNSATVPTGAGNNERHTSIVYYDGANIAETRAKAEELAFGSSPAPTVTKPPNQTSIVNQVAGSLQIVASNVNATNGFAATGLPTGFTINTNTGLISGTPTVSGNKVVTIKVTGPGGTAETTFEWNIIGATAGLGFNKAPAAMPALTQFSPVSNISNQELAERFNELVAVIKGFGGAL